MNCASVWWNAECQEAVWICRVPGHHARDERVSGVSDSISDAHDAAHAHLRSCSLVLAGLDRLVADVMALPEYRHMLLADPTGRVHLVVACVDCGHTIADEVGHTVTHIEAREFAQGVSRG